MKVLLITIFSCSVARAGFVFDKREEILLDHRDFWVVLNCSASCLLCHLEVDKFSKKFTKVILPFDDNLLFCGVNVHIDEVSPHGKSKVHEVAKAAFRLVHVVAVVHHFFYSVRLHKAVICKE